MNSFLSATDDLLYLLIANGAVVSLLYALEKGWGFRFEASTRVKYEMIDLITPANRQDLLADLRQRTGLPVKRAKVGRIDFLKDVADITVYYDEPKAAPQPAGQLAAAKLSEQTRPQPGPES
jgi:hypothetical protein